MPTRANLEIITPSTEGIKQTLQEHLHAQLALCDALEKIADSLPNQVDEQTCLCVARSIYPIIHSAHEFEETVLFSAIESKLSVSDTQNHVLDRLHAEHWEDESFGEDIAENLKSLATGENHESEKLGYMLRGFFEGLRRHIAYEREHLVPLLDT